MKGRKLKLRVWEPTFKARMLKLVKLKSRVGEPQIKARRLKLRVWDFRNTGPEA